MEFATLQAQIRASRQAAIEAAGASFNLQLPSDHAWRVTLEANRDEIGRLQAALAAHQILSTAITGWSGVTARHLLADGPDDPVDFSPGARAELLDARPDIADELMAEIGRRLKDRRDKRDAARKN